MEPTNQEPNTKTKSSKGGVMRRFSIGDIPKGDFHAGNIAQKYYPECVSEDSEGRIYNRAIGTVYRILRRMDNILDVGDGVFFNAS